MVELESLIIQIIKPFDGAYCFKFAIKIFKPTNA